MIDTDLMIIDGATPFLQYMAQTKPDWMRKAMKSFGWFSQQQIKKGIRSGAPGGQQYAKGMSAFQRKALGEHWFSRMNMLGKLVNAVGYEYKADEQKTVVGWLSQSAIRVGTRQEEGLTHPITEGVRRVFFAAGIPLSNKPMLVTPARHTFGPMQAVLAPQASTHIENKILEYMNSGTGWEQSTKKRKYRVRG